MNLLPSLVSNGVLDLSRLAVRNLRPLDESLSEGRSERKRTILLTMHFVLYQLLHRFPENRQSVAASALAPMLRSDTVSPALEGISEDDSERVARRMAHQVGGSPSSTFPGGDKVGRDRVAVPEERGTVPWLARSLLTSLARTLSCPLALALPREHPRAFALSLPCSLPWPLVSTISSLVRRRRRASASLILPARAS